MKNKTCELEIKQAIDKLTKSKWKGVYHELSDDECERCEKCGHCHDCEIDNALEAMKKTKKTVKN